MPRNHFEPFRVLPLLCLPADSLLSGHMPAQEARCYTRGGAVVFFGRFISILRIYAAFLAGTSRMPWRRFLVSNAAGGIVWATAYGTAAFLLGGEVDRLSRPLAVGFGLAGAAVMVAALLVLRRHEARLAVIAAQAFPGDLEGYAGAPRL